jgi:hypothetical protein
LIITTFDVHEHERKEQQAKTKGVMQRFQTTTTWHKKEHEG